MSDDEQIAISRRTVLKASGSAAAVPVVGAGRATADGAGNAPALERCPDATLEPSMGHCEGTSMEGCADDHSATVELREAVRETLEAEYPHAGALLEAGFKPYFDTLDIADEDGWSHWLQPEFIGDDAILDPERPESVLVDNTSWRSIGVMFIAASDGEIVEPPPAVYDERSDDGPGHDQHGGADDHDGEYPHEHGDHDERGEHDEHGDHDHNDERDDRCSPWHYHAGLPSRFAWWFYQHTYEQRFADGERGLPCRTPCMMHVWTVDHPEGVYAHDGPPAAYRDQEPAAEAGFETDAEPGADELEWGVLPDEAVPEQLPHESPLLNRLLP